MHVRDDSYTRVSTYHAAYVVRIHNDNEDSNDEDSNDDDDRRKS